MNCKSLFSVHIYNVSYVFDLILDTFQTVNSASKHVVRGGIEVLEMMIVCVKFAMYCVYLCGVKAYLFNLSEILLFQLLEDL